MLAAHVLIIVFCALGVRNVLSKNIFVSHRGKDVNDCGGILTIPCHSVRQAVRVSSADDIIYIDNAGGKPYRECENLSEGNHTIMLDKSLSFYGLNGAATLNCEQPYTFFAINSSKNTTSKVVFSNLSFVSDGVMLLARTSSKFQVEFRFCDIKRSLRFIHANSLSCTIHLHNSIIRSLRDAIRAESGNLITRLYDSTFSSCVSLSSNGDTLQNDHNRTVLNVHIYNCTFSLLNKQSWCDNIVGINRGHAVVDIKIESSKFLNFYNLAEKQLSCAFCFYYFLKPSYLQSLVLDNLLFENITCSSAVVNIELSRFEFGTIPTVGISNSNFVNTTLAFRCGAFHGDPIPSVIILRNNTFNITHGALLGNEGSINLGYGQYYIASCRFIQYLPRSVPKYPFIHFEGSSSVYFVNSRYETYLTSKTSHNSVSSNINMFYPVLFIQQNTNGFNYDNFTILCPHGYQMNLQAYFQDDSLILYSALCEQCRRNTYSFVRGEARDKISNNVTCQDCPVGGKCVEGQITSKHNFWGYKHKSNLTVQFILCPPKYCCDKGSCSSYDTCHGNRIGTLCGECPSGMSESLLSTECRPNKDCTSVLFWPVVSVYLILYLLFFLYQEDIVNFILRRLLPRKLSRRRGKNTEPGGLVKIIFYYYQVAHLLRISGGSQHTTYFNALENFFSRTFNFLIISIASFDCPFKDLRPVPKAIIVHSAGYISLLLLGLLYLSKRLLTVFQKIRTRATQQAVANETTDDSSDQEESLFMARLAGAFTNISLLMYATSTQLCLSLLHCVPVGDSQVLFLDGNIKCHQPFQSGLFAYMISSILPFCLVPVLGSYLLKADRIGVGQFCLSCIFPFPFCCYWLYLLANKSSWRARHCCRVASTNQTEDNVLDEIVNQDLNEETQFTGCKSSVLRVLLGPFRSHKATFIFPSSHIPWEGFLVLRRLLLILVLTFVPDNHVKATLSMVLCVVILLPQIFVWPFKSTSDNVLETLSLGTLIIISGLKLVNSFYYGRDSESGASFLLDMVNVIESILITLPVALLLSPVIVFMLWKVIMVFRACVQALYRGLKRLIRSPSENWTREETRSLLSGE